MSRVIRYAIVSFLLMPVLLGLAQNNGDFRSRQNGDWSNTQTWEEYVSGSWSNTTNTPNSSSADVQVRHTVDLDVSPRSVRNLTIDSGAKLHTTLSSNRFINLYGNLQCDGQFGDGTAIGPEVSLNVEGRYDTIRGTGDFQPARIEKNSTTTHDTTALFLDMNGTLVWNGTGLYIDDVARYFEIKIAAGRTLTAKGSVSIDGTNGISSSNARGKIEVYGTLIVEDDLIIRTNNSSRNFDVRYVVKPGGTLSVYGEIDTKNTTSGDAKSILVLDSSARFNLFGTGTPIQNIGSNDSLDFHRRSTVYYAANGAQDINASVDYGNLELSGSGTKTLMDSVDINGKLLIGNNTVLDVSSNNYAVHLQGDWQNNNSASDGFIQREGKVYLESSSMAQTIADNNNGETFSRLVVDNSQNVIIQADSVMVEDSLFLNNGLIVSGSSNLLIMKLNSEVSPEGGRQNSYVNGPMRWELEAAVPIVFPLGKDSADIWARCGIEPRYSDSRSSTTRTFQAEYIATGYGDYTIDNSQTPPMDRVSAVDYWNISEVSGASGNDLESRITLYWHDSSYVSGLAGDRDSLVVAHWISGSSHWTRVTNPANKTINNISANEGWVRSEWLTSFSPFTLGSDSINNPLPVQMLSMDVLCLEDNTSLFRWQTASEVNSESFDLHLSTDGLSYQKAATVPAAGFSNQILSYEASLPPGYNYLKLKQTDFDGRYEWFGPVVIPSCTTNSKPVIRIIRKQMNQISLTAPSDWLNIYDLSGRLLMSLAPQSNGLFNFNDNLLPNGLYVIRDANGNFFKYVKY